MRRISMSLGVLALALLAASAAEAVIANGPGMRVYLSSSHYSSGGDYLSALWSAKVKPDWTLDTTDGAAGFTNHGSAVVGKGLQFDNSPENQGRWYSGDGVYWGGIDPMIETSRPEGFADIIMGTYKDGTTWNNPNDGKDYRVMDVVRYETSAGGMTVTTVGGRGAGPGTVKDTISGFWANPAPAAFTGPDQGYVLNANNDGTTFYYNHEWGTAGGTGSPQTGIGATAADWAYAAAASAMPMGGTEREYVGKYAYMGPNFGGYSNWYNMGLEVVERTGPGAYAWRTFYRKAASADNIAVYGVAGGIAAGTVEGHQAVWALAKDLPGNIVIGLFIDRNDDGDAMDSGENLSIISAGSSANAWADPAYNYQYWGGGADLELIDVGGMKFLALSRLTDLVVYQLADNGEYAGSTFNEKVARVYSAVGTSGRNFSYMELDYAAPVPEPATLLLAGTGALALFGYIRRRMLK